jgi:hypothetical protein
MTTLTRANGLFAAPPGTKLLGEIITWSCAKVHIRHLDLVAALRAGGLDESVARELAPRHAFARACQTLSEARIIRPVAEDEVSITFQFTAEHRHGDHFTYDLETMLTLDKATGQVTCGLPGLATLAQAELDRCLEARTGADVTRVVQKLFERRADLFPIREQGGAYFVPHAHAGFVDQVQGLVGRLGGRMYRFPVPAGTPEGDRSVRESVAAGLAALVAEHRQAVAAFGDDAREATLERAAERIRQTRFKVESYAALLAEHRDGLERELAATADALRRRIVALAADTPTAAPALV